MPMNIIFSSDDNFAQHLGVTICSLFENNTGYNFNIYVIDGGISDENKKRLSYLEKKYNFSIIYLVPDNKLFENVYISGHISKATYYRLSIGELLPKSVDKIIYLDCDIVVIGKIIEMWNIDIDNNILGAVTEKGFVDFAKLGIDSKENYFNAGILLINLKKWRKQEIGRKCFDFIKNDYDKIVLHDQDTLNGVLRGNWKKLDSRFNMMVQDKKIILNPVIIHYNSWVKPWNYLCNHPQKYLYYKYLHLIPWRDYRPRFPSLIEIIKYYYHISINETIRIVIRKHILTPLGLRKK